jgi:hypothetical protein
MSSDIPLKVLVCDSNTVTAEALVSQLKKHTAVVYVKYVHDIKLAQQRLRSDDINTIFIDPLLPTIEAVADFVFSVRKALPEIVFALYMDVATAEAQRGSFYRGDRQRFIHYYKLDKAIPVSAFPDEVAAVIRRCQAYLRWRLPRESLRRLTEHGIDQAAHGQTQSEELRKVQELLARVSEVTRPRPDKNKVFLSYRFAETEYADGLIPLLEERGFKVITGKRSNTFISRTIIDRIRDCEYFLCLMTRDKEKVDGTFTTSPWLLEEKGVALALGKQLVLMVEEGVDDFGELQGDWQRIHFGPKGFLKAALEAARQLATYNGQGEDENTA